MLAFNCCNIFTLLSKETGGEYARIWLYSLSDIAKLHEPHTCETFSDRFNQHLAYRHFSAKLNETCREGVSPLVNEHTGRNPDRYDKFEYSFAFVLFDFQPKSTAQHLA